MHRLLFLGSTATYVMHYDLFFYRFTLSLFCFFFFVQLWVCLSSLSPTSTVAVIVKVPTLSRTRRLWTLPGRSRVIPLWEAKLLEPVSDRSRQHKTVKKPWPFFPRLLDRVRIHHRLSVAQNLLNGTILMIEIHSFNREDIWTMHVYV